MNARRLTTRQLAAQLARIDAELAAINGSLELFGEAFGDGSSSDAVDAAWNALTDARAELSVERLIVARNDRPSRVPAATAKLVRDNMD